MADAYLDFFRRRKVFPTDIICYATRVAGSRSALAKGKRSPMKTTRTLNRRSFFFTVAGTVAAATTVGLIAPTEAEAMQCTDSDTGSYSDPAGSGRRCGGGRRRARSGCTDRDSGRGADGVGYGRRCGNGGVRRRSGCTDRDSGRYADGVGAGRRCGGVRRRNCSDSDSGRYGDPGGRGRRC
jgi:hypothetical protein